MFASKDTLFTRPSGGYTISRSVRLRSSASAYFNRTFSTPTNQKIWTWSGWVKRGLSNGTMFYGYKDANNADIFNFDTDRIQIACYESGYTLQLMTTPVYRDPSAWYHIVLAVDTTQATASNRAKLYINGSQVITFSTETYPSQNTNLTINSSGSTGALGASYYGSPSAYFDGYLTEINFIDGQALTPSSFGSTNAITGVWQPAKYTGTYGTNGFYLNFSDNSNNTATTIGKDYSGNGNNWTPNNISVTAGATYDSMTDVPTLTSATAANYAVLSPLTTSPSTFSNGNLTITGNGTSSYLQGQATVGSQSGKFYCEFTLASFSGGNGSSDVEVGIDIENNGGNYGRSSYGVTYIGGPNLVSGQKRVNGGSPAAYGASWTVGDVIGIALDISGSVTFYKNNASQGAITFTPLAGNDYTFTVGSAGGYYSAVGNFNFGQQPFTYTPPSGYVALNTYNLPASTISNGATVMAATLYTGNGSTQTVNNAKAFYPDFNWIKDRTGANSHVLVNSVVGGTSQLFSNLTNAEQTNTSITNGISASGIALGNNATGTGATNLNGNAYVLWQWQAGQGSTSSNTSGSITSTVSVNATAGFSVVTYTGNGVNNATVGHGLGVTPSMIIVKSRTQTYNWDIYHQSLGITATLTFTTAATRNVNAFGTNSPTSSVFSVYSGFTNDTSANLVAYCWAAVKGFSAFGSYTGNGSADGVFVYTGFRPRWVMVKASSAIEGWVIWDSSRDTYNVMPDVLYPNGSNAEVGNTQIDFLSNGFKLRNTTTNGNISGTTYIYAAFAENPTKYALAR